MTNVSGLFPPASLFFGILLLAEGLGNVHPPVARLMAWTLLLVYGVGIGRDAPARRGPARLAALAIAAGAALLSLGGGGTATLAVPVWLIAVAFGFDLPARIGDDIRTHLAWAYGFSLLSLVYHQDPSVRWATDIAAIWVGARLADFLGVSWAPGSTALGFLTMSAYALAVLVALPRKSQEERLPTAAAAIALLALGLAIHTYLSPTLTSLYEETAHFAARPDPAEKNHAGQHSPAPVTWAALLAASYPMNYQLLLAGFLAFAGRRGVGGATNPSAPSEVGNGLGPRRRVAFVLTGATLASAACWIWSPVSQYAPLAGLRVMVHKQYLDWTRPDFDSYGDRAGGMFGMLADHLQVRGCSVTAEPLGDAMSLKSQDVLILINLQERFGEAEKRRIREFVRAGGGLLIAGDHTGLTGLREPVNDLVGDLGLGLNFDTAKPFSLGWTNGLEYMAHPVTRGLPWWINESSTWVGASVEVRPPAYPVVIGRYAFIDPGDQTSTRGKLGDMKYSNGERLGDVPIVAAREYGRGKILVWGDTSPLQNGAWLMSHRYMERTLAWLGRPGGSPYAALRPAATPIFLAAACLLPWLAPTSRMRAAVMALVLFGTAGLRVYSESPTPKAGAVPGRRVYIDVAHLPADDLNLWYRDGFGGFAQTLSRTGLLPYCLWDWDATRRDDAALVVLLAPSRALSGSEQRRMLEYIEKGGHVLVAVGWEEWGPLRPFLKTLGLEIDNAPLGQAVGTSWRDKPVQFANAWPIVVGAEVRHASETLARIKDSPCVVRCRRGRGSFTLIGDSRFLRNGNLEGRFQHVPENIEFVRSFIQSHVNTTGAAGANSKESR